MELQQNLDAIRKQGLGVAAISYDSTGVLKSFANRQHIAYPLLSEPLHRDGIGYRFRPFQSPSYQKPPEP